MKPTSVLVTPRFEAYINNGKIEEEKNKREKKNKPKYEMRNWSCTYSVL